MIASFFSQFSGNEIGTLNLIIGTIAAAIVGYLSIAFFLGYLRQRTMDVFIGYRLIVGIAILFMVYQGVIRP